MTAKIPGAINVTTPAATDIVALGTSGPQSAQTTVLHLITNTLWTGIPTADPHVVGKIWSNAGVVTISAG